MLADLVHHVRQDLSRDLIYRTIHFYTQNMHDCTLSPSIQTMCAKLLLNLIDCIMNGTDRAEVRKILVRMLDAFIAKFGALTHIIPKVVKRYATHWDNDGDTSDPIERLTPDLVVDAEHLAPVRSSAIGIDHYCTDIARDYKFLFKTLILGLKTVVFGLKNYTGAGQNSNKLADLSQTEIELFVRVFIDGLKCFSIFTIDTSVDFHLRGNKDESATPPVKNPSKAQDQKEILEHFVTVFTLVDAAVLQEVFQTQIPFFFEKLLEDPVLLAVPQYLLASETVSRMFAGILLRFLMLNLEKLGEADANHTSLMLRLFKLVFMAVTLFPDSNETVLQPHISTLITQSMKLSAKFPNTNNYFLLMRALFRNIGGGRFELLYKEVLPLLPFLLKSLNTLLAVNEKSHMRNIFVELCLTVPVRLSVLLPYLHYLVRPLVLALDAGPDLISQGLRTLELCIDNLTAEFLDPILAPAITELMASLWKHLNPLPYNQSHAHATLRILGKLGGRNRRIMKETVKVGYNFHGGPSFVLPISFDLSSKPYLISLDDTLDVAESVLKNSSSIAGHVEKVFEFLRNCLPIFIDVELGKKSMASLHAIMRTASQSKIQEMTPQQLEIYASARQVVLRSSEMDTDEPETAMVLASRDAHGQTFERILLNLFQACSHEYVFEKAKELLTNLTNHFAILKFCEVRGYTIRAVTLANSAKKLEYLDSNIFYEALIEALTSDNEKSREVAIEMLAVTHSCLSLLSGSLEVQQTLPVYHMLASKFCSSCYINEWHRKMGGCEGIRLLSTDLSLGQDWLMDHQLEFVKALLFIFKDMPDDLATHSNVDKLRETLVQVVRNTVAAMDSEKGAMKFNNMMSLLVSEVSNSNAAVRENVKASLAVLSEMRNMTVTELLTPVKARLMMPIFSKPLRALPFPMQIGKTIFRNFN